MGNVAVGGMSDVLRIQMERAGLEDNLASLLSARLTGSTPCSTVRPMLLSVYPIL